MQDAGKISAIFKKKSGAAGIAAPEGKTRSFQGVLGRSRNYFRNLSLIKDPESDPV